MRKTSFVVSFVFCSAILLLLGSVSNAKTVKFSIANSDGSVDSTAKTPLLVEEGGGLGALQLNVMYDPAVLEPISVESADGVNALVDFNVISPGTLRVALASTQGVENDGDLLQIKWKVLAGTSTKLDMTDVRAWKQKTSFELPVSVTAGEFTVTAVSNQSADDAAPATISTIPLPWLIGIAAAIGVVILLLLLILLRRK